ncbi:nitroreductase [Desulfocapsa sulfexigens DSM 10523]|uniref:Nitroreductase n=1 Tax=Desulfocapsa sulfexigens (strain DSM 10523 / SB164P1) TaxID=1167006 RepID=M1P764_DESSD|nr:nitroreductase [Desulfocapsa sulfexigens]AGF77522.1 nitroreductase [Desulfocapsa sulfexigens DSM 10523]
MDTLECIKTRRSIRKFTTDPVPRKDLEELIETARWSPSYKNSQPWQAIILSGNKKQELSKMLIGLLEERKTNSPDLVAPTSWPEAEQKNISHLLAKRMELTGIDLGAPEMIVKAKKANFNFYYAPHAIYLYQDGSLSEWSLFDIGLFAQSLMLAAHAKGLATVPQAFATDYAKEVKECLGIPASKRLILGLSVGYPDMDSPVNAYRTERADIEDFYSWME